MVLKEKTVLQNGKYILEKMLGQGGSGITYLGTQTGLERKVAVKEFFMKVYCERTETGEVYTQSKNSAEYVSQFKEKFLKEARMIAQLEHPHIIRIYDVFEENGTAYFVMEYMRNGSLADLVKKETFLSEEEGLRFFRQIANALKYLHETEHINHLDVKPSNILLNSDMNAVLIDFGISKHYNEEGQQTTSTPVGLSYGYAPLEQYKNTLNEFSPATDIYSLGATLYKMITGNTPPDATEIHKFDLLTFPANISNKTKYAICQSLQTYKGDRPQSIDELLDIWTKEPVSLEKDEETMFPSNTSLKKTKVDSFEVLPKKNKQEQKIVSFFKRKKIELLSLLTVFIAIVVFALWPDSKPMSQLEPTPVDEDTIIIPPLPNEHKRESKSNADSNNKKVSPIEKSSYELKIKTLRNSTNLEAASTTFKDGDDFYLYLKSTEDLYVAVFMEDKGEYLQLLPYNGERISYELKKNKGAIFFNSSPNEMIMTCEGQRVVNKMYVISSVLAFSMVDVKIPNDENELPYMSETSFNELMDGIGINAEMIEIITTK